jgi:predicted MFS family arabinose efflux permease
MGMGYKGLFWVDGFTCIIAISIFALLVKEKEKPSIISDATLGKSEVVSVFKDKIFWIFLFVSFVTAMIFFQLFTTLPLYHHERFSLTEFQTGLLMTLNGLLIFALEMPFVSYFERKKVHKLKIILWGTLLMSLGFYLLLINFWAGILIVSMIFISIGEIFAFPFSNVFALSRAPIGHEGRYMALYTMSFSTAHIVSSKMGMEIIGHFGYQWDWIVMGSFGVIAAFCCIWIQKLLKLETKSNA